ncbi:Ig-like domain-containing protein [Marinobacter sp. M216]|uniref:Ig-like domain-containing protein n=1 Tax=Marinobacter albus TaxID=3030833 RepID=A0ABT7HET1_9GAMM|nr:Ig-like domain-containing protein [Marinobacter sp. M216]MDK9558878.1 Ig-like domain-containing protein [Marinobacter sp. M216]
MKYNKTLALIPAMLLAACGGEEQTVNKPAIPGSVVYSYPADGQSGISPTASIVVRFSHAISDKEADLQQKILVTDGSTPVAFTVTKVDGGRSLKLTPTSELTTGTDYSVTFTDPLLAEGAREVSTPNAQGPDGIQFSTRGGFTGIADLDSLSGEFGVAELIPSPNDQFKPMNFSTFRLTLTQPVHPEWRAMGGQITLENGEGETVPTTVLVDGRRITVDPCTVGAKELCGTKDDALTAGETYTLRIQGLPSQTGAGTLDFTQVFVPRETGPTVVLFQEVIDSGLLAGADESGAQKSVLNGQIINGVTLNSVLQGVAGPSQQTGGLFAELAYAPSFSADEPLPLRVPKGSVLTSSSLDVRINGSVPVLDAGTGQLQTTGDINVTMLSDATGYLSPNPYTDDLSAPRHVKLFMDVAMNTEEAQPNASLSQDLLGVELSGIALVKDGVLTIDAIGVVEPELLGQEYTDSTIAFQIEAATDANSVLDAEQLWTPDTTSPQLVSWMPGPTDAIPATRQSMQRPGDPVILNFDEPLDGETSSAAFTLFEENSTVPFKTRVDGTTVTINPEGGLKHGVDYSLLISPELTDLAGNGATEQTLRFSLPAIRDGQEASFPSPIALTTYPGFPCVTENLDIANGEHGTCIDDAPGDTVRDQIPVMTMPRDRPIVVKFSQSMDLASINPQSFVVEKIADPSAPGPVGSETILSGRLEKNNQHVRFYPDQPWEIGETYRYTMRSEVDGDCSSGSFICSEENRPLQTDLLVAPSDFGGPDLSIYFTGSTALDSVFTPLRNLPIRDTNSNYMVDCDSPQNEGCLEPFDHETDGNGGFLPSANSSKLTIVNGESSQGPARVGCSPDGADCPTEKFIYQTYGLDTEVIGPALDDSGNTIGVRVLLYPTLLATSSARVIVSANLLLGSDITSDTGTQILRMTYGEPTDDNPLGLVEGVIVEGANGGPVFKTEANLTLDAPELSGVDSHDVYSKPLTLKLEGPITFFDDGRMQIEQRNVVQEDIIVNATSFGFVDVKIPLRIPALGTYLNFISNPIKEIPAQQ